MVNLLIVSWDAAGLSICETTSERKIQEKRDRILFPRIACTSPQFFKDIRRRLETNDSDIFVFTTQNENGTSYLHSEYLPNVVEEINYTRVAYKSVKTGDTSFRMSVFCKSSLMPEVTFSKVNTVSLPMVNGNSIINYLEINGNNFAFVAVNANNPNTEIPSDYLDSIYSGYLAISLTSLINDVKSDRELDKIFMFGHFDTTISGEQNSYDVIYNMEQLKTYGNYIPFDSMKTVLSFPSLWWFKEGLNGIPNFPPTWPLLVGRNEKCTRGECFDPTERKIGWTDRILHYSSSQDFYNKSPCVEYTSLNLDGITNSDYAMVVGVYSW